MIDLKAAAMLLRIYQPQVEMIYPEAMTGDREAALRMLAMASGLIAAGYPMPPKLNQWIATGLRRLATGHSAEEAFQFQKRKRGNRAGTTELLQHNDRFVQTMLTEISMQANGLTAEEAFEAVAKVESVSEETVRRAWLNGHREAKIALAASGWLAHLKW